MTIVTHPTEMTPRATAGAVMGPCGTDWKSRRGIKEDLTGSQKQSHKAIPINNSCPSEFQVGMCSNTERSIRKECTDISKLGKQNFAGAASVILSAGHGCLFVLFGGL